MLVNSSVVGRQRVSDVSRRISKSVIQTSWPITTGGVIPASAGKFTTRMVSPVFRSKMFTRRDLVVCAATVESSSTIGAPGPPRNSPGPSPGRPYPSIRLPSLRNLRSRSEKMSDM